MEYYDKYGNIKRINVQFEPVASPRRRDSPQVHRPMALFSVCDKCDDQCFYGRYRQYCSTNFIGKCKEAKREDERANERRRQMDIIIDKEAWI